MAIQAQFIYTKGGQNLYEVAHIAHFYTISISQTCTIQVGWAKYLKSNLHPPTNRHILLLKSNYFLWEHYNRPCTFPELNRPVNLHSLFLFWKPGSVCDPEKNRAPCFLKKPGCKKPRSLLFKKRRGSLVFSLFWITMTFFFLHPGFCKKQGPQFFKSSRP